MCFPVIAQFILLTPSLPGNDSWFVWLLTQVSHPVASAWLLWRQGGLTWREELRQPRPRWNVRCVLLCQRPARYHRCIQLPLSHPKTVSLNVLMSLRWRRCMSRLMSQLPEHLSRSPCFQLSPTVYARAGTVITCSFFFKVHIHLFRAGVMVLPPAVN